MMILFEMETFSGEKLSKYPSHSKPTHVGNYEGTLPYKDCLRLIPV